MCAQRKTCSSTASMPMRCSPCCQVGSGLGFVAETVRNRAPTWRADDQQGELASPALSDIARPAVVVEATVSLRHVVRLMHQEDASSAVAIGDSGIVGIVTDHDLRNRVRPGRTSSTRVEGRDKSNPYRSFWLDRG